MLVAQAQAEGLINRHRGPYHSLDTAYAPSGPDRPQCRPSPQRQPRMGFDDPESLTRDAGLSVVRARAERTEPFDINLFAGFKSMKALTYTASIC